MSIINYLLEGLNSKITAYHGSNSNDITKFTVPTGADKEGVLWFTDDPSYARENGTHVYTVELSPKKELTTDSVDTINQENLFNAFVTNSGDKISKEQFDKFYPKIITGIDKFKNGDIPFYDIFQGWGDTVQILKNLGFDMYTHINTYNGEPRDFYLVMDDTIIDIKS